MKTSRRNLFALAAGAAAAPTELLKEPKTGWFLKTTEPLHYRAASTPYVVYPWLTEEFTTDAWRVRLVMRWEKSFREWRGTYGA